ncbi:MAG: hypothetical protein QOH56_2897 [Pseudonocardiales bacterium]|nr:hypothetical protein [Pseudonocardiales bacterium]
MSAHSDVDDPWTPRASHRVIDGGVTARKLSTPADWVWITRSFGIALIAAAAPAGSACRKAGTQNWTSSSAFAGGGPLSHTSARAAISRSGARAARRSRIAVEGRQISLIRPRYRDGYLCIPRPAMPCTSSAGRLARCFRVIDSTDSASPPAARSSACWAGRPLYCWRPVAAPAMQAASPPGCPSRIFRRTPNRGRSCPPMAYLPLNLPHPATACRNLPRPVVAHPVLPPARRRPRILRWWRPN